MRGTLNESGCRSVREAECRRAWSLRPRAHGELDDAFKLLSSCAGCGQDGHAADDGPDVMGQILGIGARRQIALGTGALESLADRGMAGESNAITILPTGEESSAQ